MRLRFLYDSVVVRRLPDRLLPPSSPYFHWIEQFGRSGINILPAEFDADDVMWSNGDSTLSWTGDYGEWKRAFVERYTGFGAGA